MASCTFTSVRSPQGNQTWRTPPSTLSMTPAQNMSGTYVVVAPEVPRRISLHSRCEGSRLGLKVLCAPSWAYHPKIVVWRIMRGQQQCIVLSLIMAWKIVRLKVQPSRRNRCTLAYRRITFRHQGSTSSRAHARAFIRTRCVATVISFSIWKVSNNWGT